MRAFPAALALGLLLAASAPAYASSPRSARCLTPLRQPARAGSHAAGENVVRSPPHVGVLQSASHPLRVYFEKQDYEAKAAKVLAAAERAWKAQVEGLGYPAPFAAEDSDSLPGEGLWLYVTDSGFGAGGYTESVGDIPSTPRADCSCRVIIDPTTTDADVDSIVTHEFNHATQCSTDCIETMSGWENFASALEVHLFPDYESYGYVVESFQARPELPIDFFPDQDETSDELWNYPYGAMLFPVFLKERFGGGDQVFLRSTWDAFAQPGKLACSEWTDCVSDKPNDPDWFQGTDGELAKLGSSFDAAFDEFSVWRAITGDRDDGEHFALAKSYADVAVIASHDSLPAKGSSALYLYGSAYVELIPAALGGPIRIAVEADAASEWACSLLVGRQGQATERIVLPFQGAKASLETGALAGASWAMLVVAQHADGAYDPDAMDYTVTRSFTYELTAAESADAGGDSSDAALEAAADGSASESGAGDGAAGAAAGGAATQPDSDSGCACRMGTTRGVGRPETVLLVALAAVARRLRRRARDVLFPPMS